MNILFYLTRYPGVGGIENVTNIFASQLLTNNSISVISHIQQEGVLGLDGIRLYSMPNSSDWNATENYEYAEKVVSENHFDAIIYQDSYAPTERIVCGIAQKHNIPLYVFEHNSPLFIYNKRDLDHITTPKGVLRRVLHPYILHREVKRKRYLLSHAKKYVLLSKQYIPEFCKLIGTDKQDERITYINNPAIPVPTDDSIEKENIILCVSRLAKEKCVDKMLSMWKDLSSELNDWKFVIVGDGPERQNLESIVNTNNIERVEFIGFAKPTQYYQKAKIFWMTSKYEGWGMTLMEAMQQGCVPVAFHTFSSLLDIIDDGKNGYVIGKGKNNAFILNSLSLAKDEDLRKQMSEFAMKKVEQFELSKIYKCWMSLLE